MFLSWLCDTFDTGHYLYGSFSKHDLRILAAQFATNLLVAGVMRTLEADADLSVFKVSATKIRKCLKPMLKSGTFISEVCPVSEQL